MEWLHYCDECEKDVEVIRIFSSGYQYLELQIDMKCEHSQSYRLEVDL